MKLSFSRMLTLLVCSSLLVGCGGGTPADTSDTETAGGESNTVTTEPAAETTPSDPNLLFEDTFDGTELDDDKWELCPEWDRQGGMDVWDNTMTSLDGSGHLVLRAAWDADEERVRSGAVRTNGRFHAGYGYYEASIKFPVAPGTWGAFWMMCGNVAGVDGSAADGAEIDIIESINNEANACNHALHWDGYGDDHKQAGPGQFFDKNIYDGQFHTFGLERTPEYYVFYIDGKETWRASADVCAPCPEDGYIKLTVEAAEWAGAGTDASISALPADMLVDYVRVYREKPQQ